MRVPVTGGDAPRACPAGARQVVVLVLVVILVVVSALRGYTLADVLTLLTGAGAVIAQLAVMQGAEGRP
jgi:hypothetical protein